MSRFLIPARQARAEIEILRSRFIATAAPAFSVAEAREFIQSIKGELSDASHNVPAFLIGHGPTTTAHANDDGEPAGTAGRPALAVLQGSGLGDIAVVVTRYFGGTKLGTGGLVRAYGDAVKAVLDILPRAEKVPTHTIGIALPYSFLERARRLVAAHGGLILDETFLADITLTVRFHQDDLAAFRVDLTENSNGTLEAIILDSNEATIMPLPRDN